MGIIRSHAVFYLDARARGVEFERTLTLGRQRLYLTAHELDDLAGRYRIARAPRSTIERGGLRYGEPADAFLRQFLGVRDLQTIDHSSYEGATLTHDLNRPVPDAWREQFDVVLDSGTLEHIFNVPVALTSCMQLVRRGGTLFLASPANNLCGHGFYQFSPELFFRLFKDANGFSLTRIVLVTHPFPGAELSPRQDWYEVTDPAEIGVRVPVVTPTPAFLMIEAKRADIVPILVESPQQSDYVTRWRQEGQDRQERHEPFLPILPIVRSAFKRLPARLQAFAIGWYQRVALCTLRNRRAFRRISETQPPPNSVPRQSISAPADHR